MTKTLLGLALAGTTIGSLIFLIIVLLLVSAALTGTLVSWFPDTDEMQEYE